MLRFVFFNILIKKQESEKDALRGHADPTLGVSERQFIGTSREQDY